MDRQTPKVREKAETGKRAAGKAERRRRITEAARDLIRETGDASLSMRTLAIRAGVSLATPYNLFGSKRAVVLAATQDVKDFHEQYAATAKSINPFERIFSVLEILASTYNKDPAFHRPLWLALLSSSHDMRAIFHTPRRDAFWHGLILDCIQSGIIAPDIEPDLLWRQLNFVLRSIMGDWALGEVAPEALAPTLTYGFALALNGLVTPDWRGPARARVMESQAMLRRLELRAPATEDSGQKESPDH